MDVRRGDIVRIKQKIYDVLNIIQEIDFYDAKKNEFVGEHTAVELHKMGDSSLHPTHLLKIYKEDNKEAILLRIEQDKPPSWLEKTKERGMIFSYHDKKSIPIDDIILESQSN